MTPVTVPGQHRPRIPGLFPVIPVTEYRRL